MAGEFEGNFTITVPAKPLESDFVGENSKLFVPKNSLGNLGFAPSEINPHVMVTRSPEALLERVISDRQFGSRYDFEDIKGLEDDPTRQQLIVYTFITSGDSILMYRRAIKADTRLAGNASIGFGGHTDIEDIKDTAILEETEDGVFTETRREDGSLRVGVNRELTEELDILTEEVDLKVIGAFYEEYTDEELADARKIPVGSVHTCIIAAADLSPAVKSITLQEEEIAEAYWVKITELEAKIKALKSEGVIVENWTEIGAKEFEDILEAKSSREEGSLPAIMYRIKSKQLTQ